MESQGDAIVEIAPQQIKFFGGPGKMVLPSPATVAALIRKIPANKVITTDLLRRTLAKQFEVEGACPVTTKKALKAIANGPDYKAPYWRVIKQNGELIDYFPGGARGHATLLRKEGLVIEAKGKALKVKQFKDNLVEFD